MPYSVETLKNMRHSAKTSRKTNKNRRNAVEKVYQNGFKMDDYYLKIKRKVDDCISELSNGITGMSSVLSGKCNTISDRREKQCLSDQYDFSRGLAYLEREINVCQVNVEQYDKEIADYERQIKEQGGIILPWE